MFCSTVMTEYFFPENMFCLPFFLWLEDVTYRTATLALKACGSTCGSQGETTPELFDTENTTLLQTSTFPPQILSALPKAT